MSEGACAYSVAPSVLPVGAGQVAHGCPVLGEEEQAVWLKEHQAFAM